MKNLISLFLALLYLNVQAQFNLLYEHEDEYPQHGGNSNVRAVADANNGNSFMAGRFTTSLTLGNITLTNATNGTIYYGKFNNAASTWTWAKKITLVTTSGTLAYISSCDVRDAASDAAGNLYLIGSYIGGIKFDNIGLTSTKTNGSFAHYDMYVAKINANGTCAWAKSFGTKNGSDWGQSIAVDGSGNVYFHAQFGKSNTCGGSLYAPSDIVVAKLNNAGSLLWQKLYSSSILCDNNSVSASGAITVDAAGNSYITGDFVGAVSFGSGSGLAITSSGLRDLFVAKINTGGNAQWARSAGQAVTNDRGNGVYVDASGNVYVGGNFGGSGGDAPTDVFSYLAKYNSSGVLGWTADPFPYASSLMRGGVHAVNFYNGALLAASANVGFKSVSMLYGSVITSDSIMNNWVTGQAFIRDVESAGSGYLFGIDNRCGTVDLGNLTLEGACDDCNGCGSSRGDIQLINHDNAPTIVEPGEESMISARSSETDIQVYPNPAKDEIHVRFSNGSAISEIYLFDLGGRIIYWQKLEPKTSEAEIQLDGRFADGIYFIGCQNTGSLIIKKIMVRR